MMITERTKANYKDLENALTPLGFVQEKPGMFHHELTDCDFDFTACSVPGVIKVIFDKAERLGYEAAKEEIRKVLGI